MIRSLYNTERLRYRCIMTSAKIILIYPPAAKPCEPPAGIARLAGVLRRHGVAVRALDANLEGLGYLLNSPVRGADPWTRRAGRNIAANLKTLTTDWGVEHFDRYKRAVSDLNRIIQMTARPAGVELGLANYQDGRLSPLRSRDLLSAARNPEKNIFFPYFSQRLAGILEKENPDAIGFSLNYLSQALTTFAMAGYVRQLFPDARIVLGGGLATSWMRIPLWQNPFGKTFDHLVAGAGEAALLDLLGSSGDCRDITPDYDDFSLSSYLSPGPILPYSASSGCYWNRCSFCPERAEENPYRPVPASTVIRDLHTLSAKTRPALIHLLDNAMSSKLMEDLTENPPGPPWYGFARFTDRLADPDFCRGLKKSGCRMLQLGLESGDQKVLDSLNKGINLEIAAAALKSLKKAGIATYVYLLFGTAAETRKAAEKTLNFTAVHGDLIGFLNLAIFNLPAHGPEGSQLSTAAFYDGDLSLYRRFKHPGDWHRQEVRRFLDREFTRHPAIAPILRRDPPIFTSNHAPFFVRILTDGKVL